MFANTFADKNPQKIIKNIFGYKKNIRSLRHSGGHRPKQMSLFHIIYHKNQKYFCRTSHLYLLRQSQTKYFSEIQEWHKTAESSSNLFKDRRTKVPRLSQFSCNKRNAYAYS